MWWNRRKDDDDLQEALRLIESLERRMDVVEATADATADIVARLEHEAGRPLAKHMRKRRATP